MTGIHPRLEEAEVTRLFEKYGEVEKCQIMKDPHTGESRGFGFVKMVTSDMADAAKEGLQGEVIEGRTLSIEKARRARPRTPTPGKYFGPPKRGKCLPQPQDRFLDSAADTRRPEPRRGGFDDRRRGGYSGGYGRDDSYRSGGGYRGYRDDRGYDRGYERSYDRGYDRGYREDRGYDRSYREDRGYDRRERDDGYGARVDRYAGSREGSGRDDRGERYGGSASGRGAPDDRRGPSYDRERYDRPSDRDARPPRDAPQSAGYGDSAPRGGDTREPYGN